MKKKNRILKLLLILTISSYSFAKDPTKVTLAADYFSHGIKICLLKNKIPLDKLIKEDKTLFKDLEICFQSLKEKCAISKTESCLQFQDKLNKLSHIKNENIKIQKKKPVKKLRDYYKRTRDLKSGVPNLNIYSDTDLINNGNKIETIKKTRADYLKLKSLERQIIDLPNNLSCREDEDCQALAVGHRICGGPEMYLVISKIHKSTKIIVTKLNAFNTLAKSIQKQIKGFGSICSYEMKPIVRCSANICK